MSRTYVLFYLGWNCDISFLFLLVEENVAKQLPDPLLDDARYLPLSLLMLLLCARGLQYWLYFPFP